MSVNTADATVMMMKVRELRNFRKAGGVVPEPKSHANMMGWSFPGGCPGCEDDLLDIVCCRKVR